MRRVAVVLLTAATLLAQNVPNAPKEFDGKSWWDHVKVLADDNMEGRETGSAFGCQVRATLVDKAERRAICTRSSGRSRIRSFGAMGTTFI